MIIKNRRLAVGAMFIDMLPNTIPVYVFLIPFLFVADGLWFVTLWISLIYYTWTRVYRILVAAFGISGKCSGVGVTITKGIISRRSVSSSWNSVSGVVVDESWFLKKCGCNRLTINFTGAGMETATFVCLPIVQAETIRNYFVSNSGSIDSSISGDELGGSVGDSRSVDSTRMSLVDLIVASVSSGRFLLIVPLCVSALNYIGVSVISEDSFVRVMELGHDVRGALMMVAVSIGIGVLGVAFFVIKYYRWSVESSSDSIAVKFGLIKSKEITIHNSDVHAIILTRSISFSLVGAWRVSVECRSSDESSRVRLVSPMVRDAHIEELLGPLGEMGKAGAELGRRREHQLTFAGHLKTSAVPWSLAGCVAAGGIMMVLGVYTVFALVAFVGGSLGLVVSWYVSHSISGFDIGVGEALGVSRSLFSSKAQLISVDRVDSWASLRVPVVSYCVSICDLGFNSTGIKHRVFPVKSGTESGRVYGALARRR